MMITWFWTVDVLTLAALEKLSERQTGSFFDYIRVNKFKRYMSFLAIAIKLPYDIYNHAMLTKFSF